MKKLLNKTYIQTLRNIIVTAWVLNFPINGYTQDIGPRSVIYEGLGKTASGSDEGGFSNLGTEDGGSAISFDDNTADVPVDGGISLLLAAGAVFGARQLRLRKKGR